MKKRIAFLLSIIAVILMLSACGTDPTKVDYNGKSYKQLYDESVNAGTLLKNYSTEEIEEQLAYIKDNYGEEAALDIALFEKWMEAMEVSGKFVEVKENGFTITKSGKTLTTDLVLKFEKRDVIFQLVYNYHNMELTGVTIEPVYGMGEKLAKAALNTVICMSIVFAVLIVISLLIASFKFLSIFEKKKIQATSVIEENNKSVPQIEQVEEQYPAEDTELVAVIAAAIAAYEGTSTSDFVVRSIRRR